MDCKKCGNYYPDEEKSCPYCGYMMTKEEQKFARKNHRKERNAVDRSLTREEKRELRERKRELREDEHAPVSTTLLSTKHESFGRSMSRVMLGGMIAGNLGAFIAAASQANGPRGEATFRVEYASGRVGVETVKVGSARYNLLVEKMR